MVNTIAAIATIMTFIFYVFIEWPKIQKRWKEIYPSFERFLMVISIISGFSSIIPFALSIFIKGRILEFYLSAGFTLFGFSMLIGYWVENKTFAYRQESQMRPLLLIVVAMFVIGIAGLLFYWFGF